MGAGPRGGHYGPVPAARVVAGSAAAASRNARGQATRDRSVVVQLAAGDIAAITREQKPPTVVTPPSVPTTPVRVGQSESASLTGSTMGDDVTLAWVSDPLPGATLIPGMAGPAIIAASDQYTYVSGDTNANARFDLGEVWHYPGVLGRHHTPLTRVTDGG